MYIEFGPMHDGTRHHNTMSVLNIARQTPTDLVNSIINAMCKAQPGIQATFGIRYGFYAYDEHENFMYCMANLEDNGLSMNLRKLSEYIRPFTHTNKYGRLFGTAIPMMPDEYRSLKDQLAVQPGKIEKHLRPYTIIEDVMQSRFITPDVANSIDFAYYLTPKESRDHPHVSPFFLMGINLKPVELLDDLALLNVPMIVAVNPELISFIQSAGD